MLFKSVRLDTIILACNTLPALLNRFDRPSYKIDSKIGKWFSNFSINKIRLIKTIGKTGFHEIIIFSQNCRTFHMHSLGPTLFYYLFNEIRRLHLPDFRIKIKVVLPTFIFIFSADCIEILGEKKSTSTGLRVLIYLLSQGQTKWRPLGRGRFFISNLRWNP